ncbi:hotdog fold thioesterase [Parvibaculum sedimenti]|uniref:Hotdog fold thioesterase n=1 Tax=Parvibaculum sedimenti TaxID=2608632 RepID=A0A6N6VIU8_9HYPH|nr:PaaI family thioesterase [Parvibaculum sedimenti]KAB7741196.1 hotdog fold thioesterase [Parvibaculum sedimenti]
MTEAQALEAFQAYIDISPFQRWLGLKVEEVGEGRLVIALQWREEMVSNPNTKSMHGGILASLVDLGGLYAVLTTKSIATATVDLRVDYHRPSTGGAIRSVSTIIKLGSKVSTAQTEIFGEDGKLLASGRGVYLMGNG